MDSPLKLKQSEQIHDAQYDPQTQRLTLTLNGGKFAYHDVPPETAYGLQAAPSHGKFFHQNIRGKHEFSRVS